MTTCTLTPGSMTLTKLYAQCIVQMKVPVSYILWEVWRFFCDK